MDEFGIAKDYKSQIVPYRMTWFQGGTQITLKMTGKEQRQLELHKIRRKRDEGKVDIPTHLYQMQIRLQAISVDTKIKPED